MTFVKAGPIVTRPKENLSSHSARSRSSSSAFSEAFAASMACMSRPRSVPGSFSKRSASHPSNIRLMPLSGSFAVP